MDGREKQKCWNRLNYKSKDLSFLHISPPLSLYGGRWKRSVQYAYHLGLGGWIDLKFGFKASWWWAALNKCNLFFQFSGHLLRAERRFIVCSSNTIFFHYLLLGRHFLWEKTYGNNRLMHYFEVLFRKQNGSITIRTRRNVQSSANESVGIKMKHALKNITKNINKTK